MLRGFMDHRVVQLFQYGSNMDPGRLNSPGRLHRAAKTLDKARLNGWGIRFDLYSKSGKCGVTDIVPSRREHVWGVLYKVPYRLVIAPKGHRSKMDKIEGAGLGAKSNYKRTKVQVRVGRKRADAQTYVGTLSGRRRYERVPSSDRRVSLVYFGYLLRGAAKFAFPKPYIAYLRRQAGRLKG